MKGISPVKRYICIHGHFYQPPRENPWLGEVELQDSAYPYHDWNKKITSECYAPNTSSRILGPDKKIIDIVNNYSKISFNFGPTLLSWMERNEPNIYTAIIQADKISMQNFSGHGSAIAQAYNHMIMPHATLRDKHTQVIWGIADFEYRFQRKPEGMWLPETAVDNETLEVLAEHGIKFTMLSPHQAQNIRKIGEENWIDVTNAKINPRVPYLYNLPSGKTINLFFYDGIISSNIAFNDLLNSGKNFSNKLISAFPPDEDDKNNQMVNIATDGESYGHHHRFGDMALAYCIHNIESNNLAKISIYGEFLEKNPPKHEVKIFERTAWSCAHGLKRWEDNCGCSSRSHPGWQQEWRAPLKGAMD